MINNNTYQTFGSFDVNLQPLPYDGILITTRDAVGNPTTIEYYQNSIITGSVAVSGTLVFTQYLEWDSTYTTKINSVYVTVVTASIPQTYPVLGE